MPLQNPDLAVAEIERRVDDRRFVQVLMPAMHDLPYGRRYWWPVYRAAACHGLPIGVHVFGYSGHAGACQAGVASLAVQGVFEKIPGLKMIIIEGGFGWLASFSWRLDKHWTRHRDEVPKMAQPPSGL